MRGNSGYLRWNAMSLAVATMLLLVCCTERTEAGPTRYRRQLHTSIDAIDVATNTHAETCMHNGQEELRSNVLCVSKAGCRKIEIRDECCPVYKCDCQFNDRTFENSEKISDPSTPCHVCLCRGGEIKCTTVTCYNRNDCANTTYVDGVCCPQYDNCPPLEDNHLGTSKDTTAATADSTTVRTTKEQQSMSTTLATPGSAPSSTESSSNIEDHIITDNRFAGIKIKEITKPEEIRITDDKPKLFKPPARTTSLTTVTPESAKTTPNTVVTSSEEPVAIVYESSGSLLTSIDNDDESHRLIDPELPAQDTENIDDLSSFDGTNDGDNEGNKSIRQTAEPILDPSSGAEAASDSIASSTLASSSISVEHIVSDKLIDLASFSSTTEAGSGDSSSDTNSPWSLSSLSSTESSVLDDSTSLSTVELLLTSEAPLKETGQLIYINGKPFQLRETDGLTRGNDDEEEPSKTNSRKSVAPADAVAFATTPAAVDIETSSVRALFETSSGSSSSSETIFEAVYYEPATEAPTDLSSEVFETFDRTDGGSQTDGALNSLEQSSQKTSQEFIELSGVAETLPMAFDGSGSADGPAPFPEERAEMGEGSSALYDLGAVSSTTTAPPSASSESLVSSSSEPPASASTTDEQLITSTSAALTLATSSSQDDDKTREFPEQSDDLSLHSQQMLEESVGEAKSMPSALAAAAGAATTDEDSSLTDDAVDPVFDNEATLRVIPIGRNAVDRISGTAESSTSYADAQERSPGEPWLVPEWERVNSSSSTEPAVRPPKVNRKESLILLPVDDDADFGRSAAAAAAAVVVSTTTTGAPMDDRSAESSVVDDALEASGAEAGQLVAGSQLSASAYDEQANVVGSAEGRSSSGSSSVEDTYAIDQHRHSDSKLKYYYADIPFEIFRY